MLEQIIESDMLCVSGMPDAVICDTFLYLLH